MRICVGDLRLDLIHVFVCLYMCICLCMCVYVGVCGSTRIPCVVIFILKRPLTSYTHELWPLRGRSSCDPLNVIMTPARCVVKRESVGGLKEAAAAASARANVGACVEGCHFHWFIQWLRF